MTWLAMILMSYAVTKEFDPEELMLRRIVLVRGEIDDAKATEIIARMLYLQDQNRNREIFLHIDSKGGAVSAGLAIADTIRDIAPAVHTVCLHEAHGIAAVILATGRKGCRMVHSTSTICITPLELNPSKRLTSEQSECELQKHRLALAALLSDHIGQPPDVVLNDLQIGRWFDAESAIQYGIADRVLSDS